MIINYADKFPADPFRLSSSRTRGEEVRWEPWEEGVRSQESRAQGATWGESEGARRGGHPRAERQCLSRGHTPPFEES